MGGGATARPPRDSRNTSLVLAKDSGEEEPKPPSALHSARSYSCGLTEPNSSETG